MICFAVLLAIANWASGVYLQRNAALSRDELPNYEKEREWAKKVFFDYNRVEHEYEPFVGWKMLPYKGETLTVTEEGIRHTASDSSANTSVHFFGGSTMWGEGSDDDHTIPALFSKLTGSYETYNHGQLAYNSRQELDALISLYAKDVRPDIVVFYDGVNDASFLAPKEIRELPAHRLVPMYRDKLYIGKSAVIKEITGKIFYDNILKIVHKLTYKPSPTNSPYDCLTNPAKAEQIAEMMIKNWEMAHEIVTARGGRFIAILQPIAFVGKPRTDHLTLDHELAKNVQVIYAHLKHKIESRKHDWIIDLTDRFDGNDYIYIDFCHVSPNGNQIIAKEISRIMKNELIGNHVTLSQLHP